MLTRSDGEPTVDPAASPRPFISAKSAEMCTRASAVDERRDFPELEMNGEVQIVQNVYENHLQRLPGGGALP